ncbi:C1 family peptidase [Streptomyces sp. NRRL S-337]|uniref:C1 family peptidase n=1 Tax=Streptomyces sp. NRRL S-337 TaxID=1463900 RepID=UPI0004C6ACB3|nr:C1 family peptidase [Streptomyces sp. NRRL S-337]
MRIKRYIGIATALAFSCLAPVVSATSANATAQSPAHHHRHGTGLNLAELRAHKGAANRLVKHGNMLAPRPRTGDAPESADLSKYALSPGDQGRVGSCVTWATGYSGYGILMNEQGVKGTPMAPMYIYSQIAQGSDHGTTGPTALSMEQDQGIDTKDDYWQGDFDYTTQPDDNERANAAHYKLSGYTELPTDSSESARPAIEDAISQGEPVAMGFEVPANFDEMRDAQAASSYSYQPEGSTGDGHEVTIVAYNDQGVKIENSWGDGWGDGGYFTVPWSFFDSGFANELNAMGKLVQS